MNTRLKYNFVETPRKFIIGIISTGEDSNLQQQAYAVFLQNNILVLNQCICKQKTAWLCHTSRLIEINVEIMSREVIALNMSGKSRGRLA